jgi:hypothetical protein
VSGDHEAYYREAVRFSMEAYRAPLPGDADVVVSNSYPIDVSLTFIRSKGIAPLLRAAPAASRIVVSACPEGIGHHGLFPFMDVPRFYRQRHRARGAWVRPRRAAVSVARRTARRARTFATSRGTDGGRSHSEPPGDEPPRRILLHAPGAEAGSLPADIPGMLAVSSWDDVIESVRREHPGRDRLTTVIYPCAPLQVLEAHRGA